MFYRGLGYLKDIDNANRAGDAVLIDEDALTQKRAYKWKFHGHGSRS